MQNPIYLEQIIERQATTAAELKNTDYFWPMDSVYDNDMRHREWPSYDNTFALELHKLGVNNFNQLAKERKLSGGSTHLLDYMGGGYYAGFGKDRYTYIDSMTGIRIKDLPPKAIKDHHKWILSETKRQVLEINAFSPEFPSVLLGNMHERQIPYIDIAVARPGGADSFMFGWEHDKSEYSEYANYSDQEWNDLVESYQYLFQGKLLGLISILSPDNGMAFIIAPRVFRNMELKRLCNTLNLSLKNMAAIDAQPNHNRYDMNIFVRRFC